MRWLMDRLVPDAALRWGHIRHRPNFPKGFTESGGGLLPGPGVMSTEWNLERRRRWLHDLLTTGDRLP